MTNPLFSAFKTDTDMETSGKWVYPTGEPTESNPNPPAFKIARAGGANKRFTKTQAALMKPHRILFRNSEITPEKLEIINDIAKKCFLETVLLDWKDVMDASGKPVDYSRAAAEDLMKQLPALYDHLMGEAQSLSTFNPASVEDDAGN